MTPVRIYDRLGYRDADRFDFRIHPAAAPRLAESITTGDENLAARAVLKLAAVAGVAPRGQLELHKAIPAGAGLGGGSSDAAAALLLANAAWGLNYPRGRLAELAAELGSDVPFFLAGGAAVCRGRGERIEPVAPLPRLHAVVVKPAEGVSTRAAFERYDAETGSGLRPGVGRPAASLSRLIENLQAGALARAAEDAFNRLESAAAALCGAVERCLNLLAACDGATPLMTGSGSACVALCRSARHARRTAGIVAGGMHETRTLGKVWATSTCH